MALRILGQFRLRRFAAFRADNVPALILGDVRFYWRQFGHLMPSRFALRGHLPR
jgi:hypothetical protein